MDGSPEMPYNLGQNYRRPAYRLRQVLGWWHDTQ